jgi:hypothetical protein
MTPLLARMMEYRKLLAMRVTWATAAACRRTFHRRSLIRLIRLELNLR